jgi:hypothetical protein
MIRLDLASGPYWLDLGHGVRLHVLPMTTSVMAAARGDAALAALPEDAGREQMAITLAKAIARLVVTDWEGVGDQAGRPVPVSPDGVEALLDLWPVFEAFQARYLARHLMLEQEKNGSAPSPSGTSAGADATARPAKARAGTARRG